MPNKIQFDLPPARDARKILDSAERLERTANGAVGGAALSLLRVLLERQPGTRLEFTYAELAAAARLRTVSLRDCVAKLESLGILTCVENRRIDRLGARLERSSQRYRFNLPSQWQLQEPWA